MPGALDLRRVRPELYSHLIIICGPCHRKLFRRKTTLLERFAHCRKIGVNLTMVDSLAAWNPFDDLLERDSDRTRRPDLTFLADDAAGPVVARCFIGQRRHCHYGSRQLHGQAAAAINAAIKRNGLAPVDVDTRWCHPDNQTGQNNSAAILSILKRMDLVLTTRLHGLVFGLRAGVPAIVVDPIRGGAKVTAQARALNWPKICGAEDLTPAWLDAAIAWGLSPDARALALSTLVAARRQMASLESDFLLALARAPRPHATASRRGILLRWLNR
jgi:hypothetical protein